MADGADGPGDPQTEIVRLWDPALRAFHWLLAALVCGSLLTGLFGPAIMTVHFWLGYGILVLLVFRVVWGFVGPEPARFRSFLAGPGAVLRYAATLVRRTPSHWPGHNPLGGGAVVALLALLAGSVLTGLISDPEDFVNAGPLSGMVGADIAYKATGWHASLTNAVIGLVLLHLAAVAFYARWKREDLVSPMLWGRKRVRRRTE